MEAELRRDLHDPDASLIIHAKKGLTDPASRSRRAGGPTAARPRERTRARWSTHVSQQFAHPPLAVCAALDADSDPVETRVEQVSAVRRGRPNRAMGASERRGSGEVFAGS